MRFARLRSGRSGVFALRFFEDGATETPLRSEKKTMKPPTDIDKAPSSTAQAELEWLSAENIELGRLTSEISNLQKRLDELYIARRGRIFWCTPNMGIRYCDICGRNDFAFVRGETTQTTCPDCLAKH